MNPTEDTAVVDKPNQRKKIVGYYDFFRTRDNQDVEIRISLLEKPTLWTRFWWKVLFGVDWTDL